MAWKVKQVAYADFATKCMTPTRTRETMEAYRHMSRAAQSDVKDVGGFVGGTLKGGRRKSGSVQSRTLITLDMDNVSRDLDGLFAKIDEVLPYELLIYPTHSHRPDRPRLRLVLPLDQPVLPDQYQAIARKIAERVGIDQFDDTTYQPERLMFWPSVPFDAEWDALFIHRPGPWVNGADILEEYIDWTDVASWPTSSREGVQVERLLKNQQDPLSKDGLIGVFCRTYSMSEAIAKFLSDKYEPTRQENRFTYKDGSTVGGLVVYDDKFAYSHHGTDPAQGELCNAFDLIRLHRFGAEDASAKAGTPVNRLPSMQRMLDLVRDDEGVKKTLGVETMAALDKDFDYDGAAEGEVSFAWAGQLEVTRQGAYAETPQNYITILDNDPNLKGRIRYDSFATREIARLPLPWSYHIEPAEMDAWQPWTDADDKMLANYLYKHYRLNNTKMQDNALTEVYSMHKVHPVRAYLRGLPEWDGIARLETLFVDYLGAEDNPYTRAVAKTHLVAAIARVMTPGVKYDTAVMLTGPQGLGKTTFIQLLGAPWYSNSLYTLSGKEAYEAIQGHWFIELDELVAFKKAEKEAIKSFLSKNEDSFRPAYGRRTVTFPRQCVFWGSTNDHQFLRDETGDRRFWPVDCRVVPAIKDIMKDLPEERDQIWAEALVAYEAGAPLILPQQIETMANVVREAHTEEDPRREMILAFLETEIPVNWREMDLGQRRNWLDGNGDFDHVASDQLMPREKITNLEIWAECFGHRPADMTKVEAARINEILHHLPGWKRYQSQLRLGPAYKNARQRGFIKE